MRFFVHKVLACRKSATCGFIEKLQRHKLQTCGSGDLIYTQKKEDIETSSLKKL
jgi:hypothetical protein